MHALTAMQLCGEAGGIQVPGGIEPIVMGVENPTAGGYAKEMSKEYQAKQAALTAEHIKKQDIVITTALIPGKPAPKLITAEMVKSMKPGSVIVDMAGEQGGNCELTVPGEAVVRHGVTIVGYTDLVSRLAKQSSTLYSNNLLRLTEELCKNSEGRKDGLINVNMDDDALRGLTVIKDGTITWPAPSALAAMAALAAPFLFVRETDDLRYLALEQSASIARFLARSTGLALATFGVTIAFGSASSAWAT